METQALLMETGVLCVPGIVSTCAACLEPMSVQKRCNQFEKGTEVNRCMYLVFGEFCDSMIAQATARGQVIPFKAKPKRKKKRMIRNPDELARREDERRRSIFRKNLREKRRVEQW